MDSREWGEPTLPIYIYQLLYIYSLHNFHAARFGPPPQTKFLDTAVNSNSLELRDQFSTDENFVTHDDSNEKLLGYTYSTLNDTLSINVSKNTSCAGFLTKRKVLRTWRAFLIR